MSFVREIINLSTALNDSYTLSKLPKWLKRILYRQQLKKIKRLIDKISDDIIPFDSLFDFIRNVYVSNYDSKTDSAKYKDITVIFNYSSLQSYSLHTNFKVGENNTIAYVDVDQRVLGMKETVDSEFIYALKLRISVVSGRGNVSLYYTNLDKYQEISNLVLVDLRSNEQYNELQAEIFLQLQHIIVQHMKDYLYDKIGIYDSINV